MVIFIDVWHMSLTKVINNWVSAILVTFSIQTEHHVVLYKLIFFLYVFFSHCYCIKSTKVSIIVYMSVCVLYPSSFLPFILSSFPSLNCMLPFLLTCSPSAVPGWFTPNKVSQSPRPLFSYDHFLLTAARRLQTHPDSHTRATHNTLPSVLLVFLREREEEGEQSFVTTPPCLRL